MVFEMVFVANLCTVKTYMVKAITQIEIYTNIEWTGTTESESGPIRPKRTKNKFFLLNTS